MSDFHKKLIQKTQKKKKEEEKKKLGLYLTTDHIFSYASAGISDFCYTATRGIGKTVISLETAIILKNKYGWENVKCYYFRLKDDSVKALLKDKAAKAVDPFLISKYKMDITCKNSSVYDHGRLLFEAMPLVSAGSKGKGVNLYDCNWFADPNKKRFIVTIWDEFILADGVEKRSIGNPVDQYIIYREAILRDATRLPYQAVFNFLLANNVGECAAITGALYNYIPDPNNFRRVKLTRKHALFWNVPVTDAYIEKRKNSYNSNIIDFSNDLNYTNIQKDLSLVKPKKTRLNRVTRLYKFDKTNRKKWFCLYDNKYLRQYRGETVNRDLIVPMKRYLDELYIPEAVVSTFERFDALGFMYADIMTMSLFPFEMKQIKQK